MPSPAAPPWASTTPWTRSSRRSRRPWGNDPRPSHGRTRSDPPLRRVAPPRWGSSASDLLRKIDLWFLCHGITRRRHLFGDVDRDQRLLRTPGPGRAGQCDLQGAVVEDGLDVVVGHFRGECDVTPEVTSGS